MKTKVDLTRKTITSGKTGKVREEFILFAPEVDLHILGARVHLGGRRNLLHLKRKIDRYLSDEK
jgi:hypothetical protein